MLEYFGDVEGPTYLVHLPHHTLGNSSTERIASCIWNEPLCLFRTERGISVRHSGVACSLCSCSRLAVDHIAHMRKLCFLFLLLFRVSQFWCAKDFTCKRTIRSTFEVNILMVSARGKFVFVAGEKGGGGGRRTKQRAVVAVWDGRKRGKIYPGFGGERDPTRLLTGHGRPIRSLYTPHNPCKLS